MFELDRAMKILAARYPLVFHKLLFSDNPGVKFEKVEDSVINVAEHRSDKIFCFVENKKQKIVSFEFVTQPDKKELFRFHAKKYKALLVCFANNSSSNFLYFLWNFFLRNNIND